ncbi:MAG: hypothetical protein D5S03_05360 [Desulfonatronospira sp. MSAO_Bac3]|nr:MAG: hypothetical protein D5S03_05360 [Desulfonatronospira sp. MSAO_Bac3]
MNHKDTKITKFKTVRRVFFENRETVFKKDAFSFAVFPANEKPFVLSSFVSFVPSWFKLSCFL